MSLGLRIAMEAPETPGASSRYIAIRWYSWPEVDPRLDLLAGELT